MKHSGLWNAADTITFCAHGNPVVFEELLLEDKIRVVMHPDAVKPFNEQYTNRTLKMEVDESLDSSYIFRFHSKGINWVDNIDYPRVRRYAELLKYYNINCWKQVVEKLDQGYDAAGVNWVEHPWPHFVGNIWWATSDYIKKLELMPAPHTTGFVQKIVGGGWAIHDAESWIGTKNPNAWNIISTPS